MRNFFTIYCFINFSCCNCVTAEFFLRVHLKEDNLTLPKEITLAKFAGFCYGVKRAVETVKN